MVSEAFARTTLRLALEAGYAGEVRRCPSLLRTLGLSGEEREALEALLDTLPATEELASAPGDQLADAREDLGSDVSGAKSARPGGFRGADDDPTAEALSRRLRTAAHPQLRQDG